jgi:allantoinase
MPRDVLIRNGNVVTPKGVERLDLAIEDGKIVEIAAEIQGTSRETIDASGLHIFPGVVDAHVHLNDAGATSPEERADWEGIETGSAALAAGGGTVFVDMPLNSVPATLNAAAFDKKLERAKVVSHTDFAFWGGLTPTNLGDMESLAERGVIGFKAFMTNSGVPDFVAADDETLLRGMQIAAKMKLPVGLHAEDETLIAQTTAAARGAGEKSIRAYLDSRSIEAEVLAIRKAIKMSRETGCDIHIVHVSSVAGLEEVLQAKRAGVSITAETCPHYLVLNDADVEQIGPAAKCSPPIRDEAGRRALVARIAAGDFDTVGSDHSPAPARLKTSDDFFAVWGGISSIQLTLRLMLSLNLPADLICRLLSANPATRFGLPAKGQIEQGFDADLALVDLSAAAKAVTREELLDRHKDSCYLGRALPARIVRTILRGRTIYRDGKIAGKAGGNFLRPSRR